MPESGGVQRNPEIDYERNDVSLFVIAIVAAGILVLLGVTPLIMIGAFPRVRGDVDRHLTIHPPQPRLQTNPEADLQAYLKKERNMLDSYGWVDRQHGIVRVPVEVEMRRIARTGLPGFPTAPPTEASESSAGPPPSGQLAPAEAPESPAAFPAPGLAPWKGTPR